MKNKVALVTGGMGGIGTSICQHLVKQGVMVISSYNRGGDHEAARLWREEQRKLGFDIAIRYVDVTDFQSCEKMIKNIETEFKGLDILVNNAGITRDVQLYKMDVDQWQTVLRTNLDSMFNVTRNKASLHALLNVLWMTLFAIVFGLKVKHFPNITLANPIEIIISVVSVIGLIYSNYLGGDLVFRYKLGFDQQEQK